MEGNFLFEAFQKYEEKTFIGFCTEAEIKYSEKGTASCKFSIPLSESKGSKDVLWLNCKQNFSFVDLKLADPKETNKEGE